MVWVDNRNIPHRGTGKAGCSNCLENGFDIYAPDLATGEERVLIETGYLNQAPDILGNHLALQSNDPERPAGAAFEPGNRRGAGCRLERVFWQRPSLSDRYLVRPVSGACDMKVEGDFQVTGVFTKTLETGENRKVTDYVEPMVYISGNVVLIQGFCWGGGPVNAVIAEQGYYRAACPGNRGPPHMPRATAPSLQQRHGLPRRQRPNSPSPRSLGPREVRTHRPSKPPSQLRRVPWSSRGRAAQLAHQETRPATAGPSPERGRTYLAPRGRHPLHLYQQKRKDSSSPRTYPDSKAGYPPSGRYSPTTRASWSGKSGMVESWAKTNPEGQLPRRRDLWDAAAVLPLSAGKAA